MNPCRDAKMHTSSTKFWHYLGVFHCVGETLFGNLVESVPHGESQLVRTSFPLDRTFARQLALESKKNGTEQLSGKVSGGAKSAERGWRADGNRSVRIIGTGCGSFSAGGEPATARSLIANFVEEGRNPRGRGGNIR